jgi:hypothetical protein
MTADWSPVLLVVSGIALAFAIVLGVFGLAKLGTRYYTWRTQNLSQIEEQLKEIYEQRRGRIVFWNRLRILFILGCGLVLILVVVTGRWNLLLAFLFLLVPASSIFSGLSALDLQYTWARSPFRPARIVTGDEAVRRGMIAIAIGVLSLVPCGLLALLIALLPQ